MADETTLSSETSHTGLISKESSTRDLDTTKQLGSWRFTVRAGVAVASIVFLLNLGTLIWALTLDGKDGSATVFEGKNLSLLLKLANSRVLLFLPWKSRVMFML
jgi:hypothetical protein